SLFGVGAGVGFGNVRCDVLFHTAADFRRVVITFIRHYFGLFQLQVRFGFQRQVRQLTVIGHVVGHVIGRDQLMLGIDGDLRVVADDIAITGVHAPRVGVGHGNLFLLLVQLGQQFFMPVALVLQRRDLLLQRRFVQR